MNCFCLQIGFLKNKNRFLFVTVILLSDLYKMPKVKRTRKPPPDGWELIEPTIDELDGKMREGLCEDSLLGSVVEYGCADVRMYDG